MTTMFGVNISQIIADEVGPGVFPATLTIVTPGTRTSSTSGVKPTETTSSGRGFVESFDAGSIDGSIIKKDDVSAILIADTFTPAINPKAGDKKRALAARRLQAAALSSAFHWPWYGRR